MILSISEINNEGHRYTIRGTAQCDTEGWGKLIKMLGNKSIMPFWWEGGQPLVMGVIDMVTKSGKVDNETFKVTISIIDPEQI